MTNDILLWIYYCTLSAGTLAWIMRKRRAGAAANMTGLILAATLAVELARAMLGGCWPRINPLLLSLVPAAELPAFAYLYLLSIDAQKLRKRFILITACWLLMCLVNAIWLQRGTQSNLYLLESVVLSALSVHALYYLASCSVSRTLWKTPLFRVWSMVLIYQCSTLGFWGALKLLSTHSRHVLGIVQDIQIALNIVQYAAMTYALILLTPKTPSR